MWINSKIVLNLVLLFIVLGMKLKTVYAQETINITIGEWSPYISEKLPNYGIVTHIITTVFAEAGIKVHYGFFPWKRSFILVQNGTWNASAVWGKTLEREQDCYFSDIVYTGEIVLFYNKKKPIVWNGRESDLKGLIIGVSLGSAKTKEFEDAEKKGILNYDIGKDKLHIFKKLVALRVDALDENKDVGLYILSKNFSKKDRESITFSKPVGIWNYHLIFSKKIQKNIHLMAIFNSGLLKLKNNGRLKKMWQDFYDGKYDIPNTPLPK